MSRASPKPSVDLKNLPFPELKDALKASTAPATKLALKALNVADLKKHLTAQGVTFVPNALKEVLIDSLTETIHSAENRNKDNTKKPDVEGSNVDNAETTNDEASHEENDTGTQQRRTRTLKGSSKAPVTEIVTKTVTETKTTAETEGSNTNDEYAQYKAEYDNLHAKGNFENEQEVKTKLALDVAQKKFVEQCKNKASESDLRSTLDEVKRLEVLLVPKIHDSRGFPILTPLNDSSGLPYRVEWKDEHSNKAIIWCGPPVAAIWRVVPTSEAKAYDNYTEAPQWSEGRLDDTTTSAEARQIVGVGFKYPIVVGASIDKVFEKRSSQLREDKIKDLPDMTAEAKALMTRARRRHIHVIMSYTRDGVTTYKHAPLTHWYSIAGYDETKGLRKVLNRAKEEQDRWETMLLKEYRATYDQLEIEGEELELQGSRESTPEADRLEDRRDDTPTPKKTNKRGTDTEANNSNADDSNANHSNANNLDAGNSNAGNSNAGNSNAGNSNAGNSNANHSNANHSNTNNSNADESDANDSNGNNSNANHSNTNNSNADESDANNSNGNNSNGNNSNGNNSNGNNSNGNNSNGNNSNGNNSNETSATKLVQSIELPNT